MWLRTTAVFTALCVTLAACGRSAAPAAPAAEGAASFATAPALALGSSSGPAREPRSAPLVTDSADGVHIEYHVYGHGEPAVVLIHGWSCNSTYWREQIPALESRYTTVTLDLAGHGGSGRNRSDWSMAAFGQDVAAVVQRLPNHRIVLVGHLMGGPVALEAAPLIGERLIGIVGVDTFRSLGLPPPPHQVVDRQIAAFRSDFVGEMHRFVPLLFAKSAPRAFVHEVADDMAHEPPRIAIATLVGLNSMDYATLLPRIHVPIVAIDSYSGRMVSEARIRKLAPGFRLITLGSPGDFLMLEAPREFNPILLHEIAALANAGR
ncbi:MAG TPA: alpha/beta hydrolase [Steroidobacteraceae bacterium]|nr:alpha/beta hydrolase [Steroidobacteraceae bacterium]